MIKTGLIYKATSPSGKCYVGQTIDLLDRQIAHRWHSLNPNSRECNLAFHCAIRKYGFENIKWEILMDDIPEIFLDDMEIEYIKENNSFENGYNETVGGEGVGCGENHPLFGLRGQNSPNFGKVGFWRGKTNPEHSKKMSGVGNPMYGLKRKDRSKLNKERKGLFKQSDQSKEKISKALTGRKLSEVHKQKLRKPKRKKI